MDKLHYIHRVEHYTALQIGEENINVENEKTTSLHAFERTSPCVMMQGKLAGKLPLEITVSPARRCLPLGQSHTTGWQDAHGQGC